METTVLHVRIRTELKTKLQSLPFKDTSDAIRTIVEAFTLLDPEEQAQFLQKAISKKFSPPDLEQL